MLCAVTVLLQWNFFSTYTILSINEGKTTVRGLLYSAHSPPPPLQMNSDSSVSTPLARMMIFPSFILSEWGENQSERGIQTQPIGLHPSSSQAGDWVCEAEGIDLSVTQDFDNAPPLPRSSLDPSNQWRVAHFRPKGKQRLKKPRMI